MGGTPYKPVKDGGRHSFECFCISPQKSARVMFAATQCPPNKQIARQTITYNKTTISFKVKAWQHNNTLKGTISPWVYMVSLTIHATSDTVKYSTRFLTSDMHSAYGCASQTLLFTHMQRPYSKRCPFKSGVLSRDYGIWNSKFPQVVHTEEECCFFCELHR